MSAATMQFLFSIFCFVFHWSFQNWLEPMYVKLFVWQNANHLFYDCDSCCIFPINNVHFLRTIKINPICWKSLENCKIWVMFRIKCYLSENVGCLICCYLAPVNKNLCRVSFLIAHNRTILSLIYGLFSCHKYLWIFLRLFKVNLYWRVEAAIGRQASV